MASPLVETFWKAPFERHPGLSLSLFIVLMLAYALAMIAGWKLYALWVMTQGILSFGISWALGASPWFIRFRDGCLTCMGCGRRDESTCWTWWTTPTGWASFLINHFFSTVFFGPIAYYIMHLAAIPFLPLLMFPPATCSFLFLILVDIGLSVASLFSLTYVFQMCRNQELKLGIIYTEGRDGGVAHVKKALKQGADPNFWIHRKSGETGLSVLLQDSVLESTESKMTPVKLKQTHGKIKALISHGISLELEQNERNRLSYFFKKLDTNDLDFYKNYSQLQDLIPAANSSS